MHANRLNGVEQADARMIDAMAEPPPEVDEDARRVIGAAIEVHRHLGPGFEERVYEDALMIELGIRAIGFERQVEVPVIYKGTEVARYCIDFVINRHLVLELKSVATVLPLHTAQVITYLKATRLQLGLLLNFNVSLMKYGTKRVIWGPSA